MKMLQQSYKQSIKFLETNKKQKNSGKIIKVNKWKLYNKKYFNEYKLME